MDADHLNPPARYAREGGKYADAMPALIKRGFYPLSTAAVMDIMLEVHETKDPDLREHLVTGWHDDYKDTATSNRKYGTKVRILLEDPLLIGVTPKSTPDSNGALVITPEQFGDDNGHDLTYGQLVSAGINRSLEKRDVLRDDYAHPGWLAYADGDRHRLKNFRDMVFAEGKRRFSYDTMMGLYISDDGGLSVRPVILDRVESGSGAIDWGLLGGPVAQLVGIAADVADLPSQSSARVRREETHNSPTTLEACVR